MSLKITVLKNQWLKWPWNLVICGDKSKYQHEINRIRSLILLTSLHRLSAFECISPLKELMGTHGIEPPYSGNSNWRKQRWSGGSYTSSIVKLTKHILSLPHQIFGKDSDQQPFKFIELYKRVARFCYHNYSIKVVLAFLENWFLGLFLLVQLVWKKSKGYFEVQLQKYLCP